jgi:ATP-dependent DNA helicase RecQ
MGSCGDSCDVCTGRTVVDMAAEAMIGGPASASRTERRPSRASMARPDAGPADEELFGRLRALRKELADQQGVPAYIVFSDKVLWEMAARRPSAASELLDVPGVGPAKLERYGERFLVEIAR